MSAVDDILSQIPMSQLARQLGVDEATAEQAARQAIPSLLGGLQANAQDPDGAASLSRAVGKHSPGLIDGGVDLGDVDTADGQKIVRHVFGPSTDEVVNRLGGTGAGGGVGKDLVAKLLPILAPIVLSYIANRLGMNLPGGAIRPGGSGGGLGGGGLGADILQQVLGSLLGGGQAPAGRSTPQPQAQANPLDDLLGNVLGGLLGKGRR